MQLAPIVPASALTAPTAVTTATTTVATVAAPAGAPSPVRASHRDAGAVVAPAGTAAPVAGAIDGAALLAGRQFIDFPGVAAGQVFDIVKGSKVGFLGVKGAADILRLDDDGASFHVKAGAFGVKVDVTVDVVRTGDDTVRISSRGTGIPDQSADGRVVENRTNYADFARVDAPDEHTIISHDGNGRIVIDTVVPTFGKAHLILERRPA